MFTNMVSALSSQASSGTKYDTEIRRACIYFTNFIKDAGPHENWLGLNPVL